jgi:cytidylate kinase
MPDPIGAIGAVRSPGVPGWSLMPGIRVAIDGPVGAGKTSAGRLLARRLGFRFLDTGLMYRAVTLAALDEGVPLEDDALVALARRCEVRPETRGGKDRIMLNGHDVTARLRGEKVDRSVSAVSAVAGVRKVLVDAQRRIARSGAIVMVGRDIGTVVLPGAEVKLYLTASPETRARRRHEEIRQGGGVESYEDVLDRLSRRDELDSSRAASPLKPAPGARIVDTDGLSLEQVVARLAEFVEARAARSRAGQ